MVLMAKHQLMRLKELIMENNVEEFAKLLEGYGTKEEKQNAANAQQAVNDLQNIQKMLQPYLVGSKAFDAKSLQQIQKKLSAPSTQQFFGRNDKKALQALQQINASINNKIKSLSQPEQPKDPAQGDNPDTQKTGETVDPNKQPAQGTEPAAPAQGDANAQGNQGEKPTGTDGAVQKVEQRIDNAALDQAIQGLSQFSKYKPIKAVIDEWAKFKQAMEQTKQA